MYTPPSKIFSSKLPYYNTELTVPAVTGKVPEYLNVKLSWDNEMIHTVESGFRVIVHPTAAKIGGITKKSVIQILESPYECGRVLEAGNLTYEQPRIYTRNQMS